MSDSHRCWYELKRTRLVQAPLAAAIFVSHFTASWLESSASNFDEDSRIRARLMKGVSVLLASKAAVMRHRVRYMNLPKSLKLKALMRELARYVESLAKAGQARVQKFIDERKPRDPYELWEESVEKQAVAVVWRLEDGNTEVLGQVVVDVDMPLSLLREVLRRRMRLPLNERCGEAFSFLVCGWVVTVLCLGQRVLRF